MTREDIDQRYQWAWDTMFFGGTIQWQLHRKWDRDSHWRVITPGGREFLNLNMTEAMNICDGAGPGCVLYRGNLAVAWGATSAQRTRPTPQERRVRP